MRWEDLKNLYIAFLKIVIAVTTTTIIITIRKNITTIITTIPPVRLCPGRRFRPVRHVRSIPAGTARESRWIECWRRSFLPAVNPAARVI